MSAARRRQGGLYVGRLTVGEGIATLCGALDLLPGVAVEVVGDGPAAGSIAAHPRARLRGQLAPCDIHELMRRASYLVLPSLAGERCPNALFDAFGNALPVIGSHVGVLLDLVDHGTTGLLFRAGSVEDLAQHIAWAETHPAAMREMGTNARRRYARFLPDGARYERPGTVPGEARAMPHEPSP